MREVDATEKDLNQVLNWAEAGEDILVKRAGRPIARVMPSVPIFDAEHAKSTAGAIRSMSVDRSLGGTTILSLI